MFNVNYKQEKKHFLLIRACVYLVLSAGQSISRFLWKSPDFFTSVSRFLVFWGWEVCNSIFWELLFTFTTEWRKAFASPCFQLLLFSEQWIPTLKHFVQTMCTYCSIKLLTTLVTGLSVGLPWDSGIPYQRV